MPMNADFLQNMAQGSTGPYTQTAINQLQEPLLPPTQQDLYRGPVDAAMNGFREALNQMHRERAQQYVRDKGERESAIHDYVTYMQAAVLSNPSVTEDARARALESLGRAVGGHLYGESKTAPKGGVGEKIKIFFGNLLGGQKVEPFDRAQGALEIQSIYTNPEYQSETYIKKANVELAEKTDTWQEQHPGQSMPAQVRQGIAKEISDGLGLAEKVPDFAARFMQTAGVGYYSMGTQEYATQALYDQPAGATEAPPASRTDTVLEGMRAIGAQPVASQFVQPQGQGELAGRHQSAAQGILRLIAPEVFGYDQPSVMYAAPGSAPAQAGPAPIVRPADGTGSATAPTAGHAPLEYVPGKDPQRFAKLGAAKYVANERTPIRPVAGGPITIGAYVMGSQSPSDNGVWDFNTGRKLATPMREVTKSESDAEATSKITPHYINYDIEVPDASSLTGKRNMTVSAQSFGGGPLKASEIDLSSFPAGTRIIGVSQPLIAGAQGILGPRASGIGQPEPPSPERALTESQNQQVSSFVSEAKLWGPIKGNDPKYFNYPKAIWRLRTNPSIRDENLRQRALKVLEDEYNTTAINSNIPGSGGRMFKLEQQEEFDRQQKAAAPPAASASAPGAPKKLRRIQ